MASASLTAWRTSRAAKLDEIAAAHRSVGGTGRGRRYATEQINHAYAVLLSSQFQGFSRDLHSECADALLTHQAFTVLRAVLTPALTQGRKLDVGNANAGNIGSDYNKFGLLFWAAVHAADANAVVWKDELEALSRWRNAIAHQDFRTVLPGTTTLRLDQVRKWRRACDGLARTFDKVMRLHLASLLGHDPW